MISVAAHAAPHYVVNAVSISDLGSLGGLYSGARDINDRGDVVGYSYNPAGIEQAFLFTGGTMFDLGPSIGKGHSAATGINNAGQIVGWGDQKQQQMGFLWMNGLAQILVNPQARRDLTDARKINDRGDIGGATFDPAAFTHDAITWKASGPVIQMPGGSHADQAYDINASGSMAGYVGSYFAWRWIMSGNAVIQSQQVPWPAPSGYGRGEGNGINDRGAVVGRFYFSATATDHAFFWDGKAANSIDLGVSPKGNSSVAEDINEDRFIAGHASEQYSAAPVAYREVGFLYHADFGMRMLPGLPGAKKSDTCRAYALNELKTGDARLQIVGECEINGTKRPVRWDANVVLVP